jgi:hypothetical protein
MDPLDQIFQTKYNEFAESLMAAFPELTEGIKGSLTLTAAERVYQYKNFILNAAGSPKRDQTKCPGQILPGVVLNEAMWSSCSEKTKAAINQFLSILTFSFVMKEGAADSFSQDSFRSWADKFMNQWRGKMDRGEFDSFTERFSELFGSGTDRLPPFPERLRKGKLVKLAEEIVKELKPEEFGLDEATIKQCESDPSKAFEILMNSTLRNPEKIQEAMKRIIKRLQEKFQKGQFNPQELAAEAEEMMKEFSGNPAFVQMMESMRKTFGFEDPEAAAAAGRPESARLAIVKDRLRRKLAAKQAAAGTSATTSAPATASAASAPEPELNTFLGEEFASILMGKKKHPKK